MTIYCSNQHPNCGCHKKSVPEDLYPKKNGFTICLNNYTDTVCSKWNKLESNQWSKSEERNNNNDDYKWLSQDELDKSPPLRDGFIVPHKWTGGPLFTTVLNIVIESDNPNLTIDMKYRTVQIVIPKNENGDKLYNEWYYEYSDWKYQLILKKEKYYVFKDNKHYFLIPLQEPVLLSDSYSFEPELVHGIDIELKPSDYCNKCSIQGSGRICFGDKNGNDTTVANGYHKPPYFPVENLDDIYDYNYN